MKTTDVYEKLKLVPDLDFFHLGSTSDTPEVLLDKNAGIMKFSRRSLPEDSRSFLIQSWNGL